MKCIYDTWLGNFLSLDSFASRILWGIQTQRNKKLSLIKTFRERGFRSHQERNGIKTIVPLFSFSPCLLLPLYVTHTDALMLQVITKTILDSQRKIKSLRQRILDMLVLWAWKNVPIPKTCHYLLTDKTDRCIHLTAPLFSDWTLKTHSTSQNSSTILFICRLRQGLSCLNLSLHLFVSFRPGTCSISTSMTASFIFNILSYLGAFKVVLPSHWNSFLNITFVWKV